MARRKAGKNARGPRRAATPRFETGEKQLPLPATTVAAAIADGKTQVSIYVPVPAAAPPSHLRGLGFVFFCSLAGEHKFIDGSAIAARVTKSFAGATYNKENRLILTVAGESNSTATVFVRTVFFYKEQ